MASSAVISLQAQDLLWLFVTLLNANVAVGRSTSVGSVTYVNEVLNCLNRIIVAEIPAQYVDRFRENSIIRVADISKASTLLGMSPFRILNHPGKILSLNFKAQLA